MPQAKALYQWEQRLATFFPQLPPRRRAWLALVSWGIILAQCALLSRVVLRLAVTTQAHAGAGGAGVTSLFALGLAWLAEQLGRGVVRRLRRLPQPEWPPSAEEDQLVEQLGGIAVHPPIPL